MECFLALYFYSWATTNCNTLQHTLCKNKLQDTARHCKTLQDTARHCKTLQDTARHCKTLQYTATHCNTVTATTHCNRMGLCYLYRLYTSMECSCRTNAFANERLPRQFARITHCITLHHTATHCNTLQHTAAHCNTPQHSGAAS